MTEGEQKKVDEILSEVLEYVQREGVEVIDAHSEWRAGHQGGWAPGDAFVSHRLNGRRVFTLSITTYEAAKDAVNAVEPPTDELPWEPHMPEEI